MKRTNLKYLSGRKFLIVSTLVLISVTGLALLLVSNPSKASGAQTSASKYSSNTEVSLERVEQPKPDKQNLGLYKCAHHCAHRKNKTNSDEPTRNQQYPEQLLPLPHPIPPLPTPEPIPEPDPNPIDPPIPQLEPKPLPLPGPPDPCGCPPNMNCIHDQMSIICKIEQ